MQQIKSRDNLSSSTFDPLGRRHGSSGKKYFHDPTDRVPSTHGCVGTSTEMVKRLYEFGKNNSGKLHVIVGTSN